MTTIATDGITIAADGRMCRGERIVTDAHQKIFVRRGIIVACSGSSGYMEPLVEWVVSGAKPELYPAPKEGEQVSSLLVIRRLGELQLYSFGQPYAQAVPVEFSIGSGSDYAMGAMRAGKGPRAAVAIATALDAHTGGEIQVVDLATALGGGIAYGLQGLAARMPEAAE